MPRFAILLAVLGTPTAGAVGARPEPVAEEPARLEEIVVTARRREELLHDIPIALSVFQEADLERRQLGDTYDLQYAAPNLVVTTDQTNRAASLVSMRGQFEPNSVPTVDSSVGLYLDGVYVARISGANLRLIDIERVEVLRGPQGTLFGRNTIGGAVSLVSNRPTATREGYVETLFGNYDHLELAGVANLPLGDGGHALRVAANHRQHSGFGRSEDPNYDLDDDDTDFARAQLLLVPADQWQLILSTDYTQYDYGGQLRTLLAASPAAGGVTAASGNPDDDIQNYVGPFERSITLNRLGSVTTDVSGAAATLSYVTPHWTFRSTTSSRRLDSTARASDQDGTPYDLAAVLQRDDEQHQFSQEFQVLGDGMDARLDWVAGLHFFSEDASFDQEFLAYVPPTGGWVENLPAGNVDNESAAAFAQVGFAFTPGLRLTAGLRWNEDRRQLTARNAQRVNGIETCTLEPDSLDSPAVCRATLPERRFDYVPFVIGLDFRPARRVLLYVKLSRGYRAGGYNLRDATADEVGTFEPERVTAFEFGAKADLLDDRFRVGLALFQSRFSDIQLLQAGPVTGQLFVQNGGKARITGGELEFTALLGELRLSGAAGLLDARFTQLDPGVVDVTLDSVFLHAPETTVSLAADLPLPWSFGNLDFHIDYAWRDDVPFSYDPQSIARQEAYGLWNARIEAGFRRDRVGVSLWGRNLADQRYMTRILNSGTFMSASLGDPRTYGLGLRYRFGR